MKKQLTKSGLDISNDKLTEVNLRAEELLEELSTVLLEKLSQFIMQSLNSKAIPSPKLLTKDHEDSDESGSFPTRLVVPASNLHQLFQNWDTQELGKSWMTRKWTT